MNPLRLYISSDLQAPGDAMYGLLLDSIQKFIQEKYGERYWVKIRRRAKVSNHWFVTHEVYGDNVMNALVEAAAQELGEDANTVMMMFGQYFVQTIGRYGYARLLRVLGRDMRDFLNGLDDLHEYLRFSYPKMRPPSFQCENETPSGMLLHYTSKRRRYLSYVIGQLMTVGKIYGKEVEITIKSETETEEETHVVLDLHFDNHEMLLQRQPSGGDLQFQIDSDIFLGIFPFCIIFGEDLVIQRVGNKMNEVLPYLVRRNLADCFTVRKPQFGTLTWKLVS